MPASKPHRRLALTQPTSAVPPEEPLPEAVQNGSLEEETPFLPETGNGSLPVEGNGSLPVPKGERPPVVRVMAYLTLEEGEALDELWFRFRRLSCRPSKSDILRAAFTLAQRDLDRLTGELSEQRENTMLRQRNSKEG